MPSPKFCASAPGPALGLKQRHPIGTRLEGPAMLLRQVPTTRINSAGYVGQLSLQRPAHVVDRQCTLGDEEDATCMGKESLGKDCGKTSLTTAAYALCRE